MSVKDSARLETSGNDGRTDTQTDATARHPLGDTIAEYAPFANNDAHNGGESL